MYNRWISASKSLALKWGGLHTKVIQIVADVLGLMSRVRISNTTTGKVPNTSATAASSGTDLNGMAALRAAETIKLRMADYLAVYQSVLMILIFLRKRNPTIWTIFVFF